MSKTTDEYRQGYDQGYEHGVEDACERFIAEMKHEYVAIFGKDEPQHKLSCVTCYNIERIKRGNE